MPVYPKQPLPDWADPAQSSVMSPLFKQVARRAVSALGLDDPTSAIMQTAMPSPLVSIYPDKVAREAGTNLFRTLANKLPDNLRASLNSLADEYPRIAAHIKPRVSTTNLGNSSTAAFVVPQSGKMSRPAVMNFTKLGKSIAETNPDKAERFVRHEATHVAQALGSSDHSDLYKASKNLWGYYNSPYEESARAIEGGGRINRSVTDIVRQGANHYASDPDSTIYEKAPADAIVKILQDRALRGWTPSGK